MNFSDAPPGARSTTLHFSPEAIPDLLHNVGVLAQGATTPELGKLIAAATEAEADSRSLILVRDDASVPEQTRLSALEQEINHARQRQLGPLSRHLGKFVKSFVGTPVGVKGRENLEQILGYRFSSDYEAAVELGERLMRPGAYRNELRLTPAERG